MGSGYNSRGVGAANGTVSYQSSIAAAQPAAAGLKSFLKTPEGRYKLQYEKTCPSGSAPSHGKTIPQITLAQLKDKQTVQAPASGLGVASGVRLAASRLLNGANGRSISSLVGGNGGSKYGTTSGSGRVGSWCASGNVSNGWDFNGKGSFLIFNVGDMILISDLESQDKDPLKVIQFSNSIPVCHAFDPDAKDGHDLLIGMTSGDVYSVSLRHQLQDPGKRLVVAQHYNKDGSVSNTRCTCIAWVPGGEGAFVVAHADGNLYVYEKNKDAAGDSLFPVVKDQTEFSVAHGRSSKNNPVSRWHVCQGSINGIAFSNDGVYLATVGRDGYLRIFNFSKEQLVCGVKGYYGALLCCAWSGDGKYVLTGGEDDLVQVWSMEDRQVIARCEGHSSWVSGVAFDTYWSPPISDENPENTIYRFGSIGQDARLLLWDLELDEIVIPQLRHPPGGSPCFSCRSHSSCQDGGYVAPDGTLQPAPSIQDVPKLSPLVAQRVHNEPLSGLMFTQDSALTLCREGRIKIWVRPTDADNQTVNADNMLTTGLVNDKVGFSPRGSGLNPNGLC